MPYRKPVTSVSLPADLTDLVKQIAYVEGKPIRQIVIRLLVLGLKADREQATLAWYHRAMTAHRKAT